MSDFAKRPFHLLVSTARFAAIVAAVAAIIIGVAWWQTGNIHLVRPWLLGQRLVFLPTVVKFEDVPPGEVVSQNITIVNISSHPLTLTGSQKTCSCITVDEFPIVIEAGTEHQIELKLAAKKERGDYEQSIKIFSDDQGSSSVVVRMLVSVK